MLRSFPPFPSPNPSTMNHPPLENAPIIPSPPSSDTSSIVSSPSSTPSIPSSPYSGTKPGTTEQKPTRSRSRSAARRCVPPRTRILKQNQGTSNGTNSNSKATSTSPTPPTTPPLDSSQNSKPILEEVNSEKAKTDIKEPDTVEVELSRNSSLRKHHYEDAMRIACGAWGETTGQKKKTVTWEKQISA